MRALAAFPNVSCKLSDLPVEADRQNWTRAQIVPYVDTVIETFGFERTIYAGDWPVCTQAVSLPDWVALLDEALSGASEAELRRLYRDNATAFYRLTL
jgi:L-fuconolactonase